MHLLLTIYLLGIRVVSGIISQKSQPENAAGSIDDIILINQELVPKDHPLRSALFEGDIMLTSTTFSPNIQKWHKKAGFVEIPYVLDSKYGPEHIDIIVQAFQVLEQSTCVRFVHRTVERDYIFIKPVEGCYSSIGRRGKMQIISLTFECLKKGKGVVLHELMHVLGFWHEHSRYDRNLYVKIFFNAMREGSSKNFCTYETTNMIGPYTYHSILHYSRYAFAKPGMQTIVPLNPHVQIGQRVNLDKEDIRRVNKLYFCPQYIPAEGETEFVVSDTAPVIHSCDLADGNNGEDLLSDSPSIQISTVMPATTVISTTSPSVIYKPELTTVNRSFVIYELQHSATISPSTTHESSDIHELEPEYVTSNSMIESEPIAVTRSFVIYEPEPTPTAIHKTKHKALTKPSVLHEFKYQTATDEPVKNETTSLSAIHEHVRSGVISLDIHDPQSSAVKMPSTVHESGYKMTTGSSAIEEPEHKATIDSSAVHKPAYIATTNHFTSHESLENAATNSSTSHDQLHNGTTSLNALREHPSNAPYSPLTVLESENKATSGSSAIRDPEHKDIIYSYTIHEPVTKSTTSLSAIDQPGHNKTTRPSAIREHLSNADIDPSTVLQPQSNLTTSSSAVHELEHKEVARSSTYEHLKNETTKCSVSQESQYIAVTSSSAFYKLELSPANAFPTHTLKSGQTKKSEILKNVVKRALPDLKEITVSGKGRQQQKKGVLKVLFKIPSFVRPTVWILKPNSICLFDYGMCGWKQSTDDDLDWSLSWGSVNPTNGHFKAKGFHLSLKSNQSGPVTGRKAKFTRLITQPFNCITFWYGSLHKIMGSLNIYIIDIGEQTLLWSAERQDHIRWTKAQMVWPLRSLYHSVQVRSLMIRPVVSHWTQALTMQAPLVAREAHVHKLESLGATMEPKTGRLMGLSWKDIGALKVVVEGVIGPAGSKIVVDNLYVGNCI